MVDVVMIHPWEKIHVHNPRGILAVLESVVSHRYQRQPQGQDQRQDQRQDLAAVNSVSFQGQRERVLNPCSSPATLAPTLSAAAVPAHCLRGDLWVLCLEMNWRRTPPEVSSPAPHRSPDEPNVQPEIFSSLVPAPA
jgi:hypothetical protein